MKEMWKLAVTTLLQFWGNGYYPLLLGGSILCLLVLPKERKRAKGLILYVLLVLVLFACPVTAKIAVACIGKEVFWRMLWLVPYGILIAGAGVGLWRLFSSEWYRAAVLLFVTAVLLAAGKNVYLGGAYERTQNLEKIPQTVINICDCINEQKTEGEVVRLAATNAVATYVRLYDAGVEMPYGRDGRGCQNKDDKQLYQLMMLDVPDLEQEVACARKNGWTYLAHWSKDPQVTQWFTEKGYAFLGQEGDYYIFKDQQIMK